MLRTRVLTAAVGLPIILAAILLGDPPFTVLVAVALAVATAEFMLGAGNRLVDPITLLAAAGSASLAIAPHAGLVERDAALTAFLVAALALLVFSGEPVQMAPKFLSAAAAVAYIGWLGHHFVLLHELPEGRDWVLLALLATFAGDTGAYAVGMKVGRHKMAPRISPKKSWEGLAGGIVAATAVIVLVYALGAQEFDALAAVVLGFAIAALGPIGDLAESMLKRGMGVKDASWLVPGHGGFMDRLDSLLFTVPAVYYFATWVA